PRELYRPGRFLPKHANGVGGAHSRHDSHVQHKKKQRVNSRPHPGPRRGEGARRAGEGRWSMFSMREQKRKESSPEPRSRGRQSAHSQVVRGNTSKRLSFIACLLFSFSAQAAELVPVE